MKLIKRGKAPPRKPYKHVIPHSERPEEGEVAKGQNTRSVRDVSCEL